MSLNHGPSTRPRIVIVDDERELATMLSHALSDEGYDVIVCVESRDALRCIKEHRPNVVILDVVMPDTDGFEVLRQLRNDPDGQRVPVILMSAAWRQHEKQRHIGATLDIAPTVVLPKPFELAELDRCLLQLGVTA